MIVAVPFDKYLAYRRAAIETSLIHVPKAANALRVEILRNLSFIDDHALPPI
jgi:hypothetical protein